MQISLSETACMTILTLEWEEYKKILHGKPSNVNVLSHNSMQDMNPWNAESKSIRENIGSFPIVVRLE